MDFSPSIKSLRKRNKERLLPLLPDMCKQVTLIRLSKSKDCNDEGVFFSSLLKEYKLTEAFVYETVNKYFSKYQQRLKKVLMSCDIVLLRHLTGSRSRLNAIKELLGHRVSQQHNSTHTVVCQNTGGLSKSPS